MSWSRSSLVLWKNVFCLLGLLVEFGNGQWVYEEQFCQTPDKIQGVCSSLNDCEPMIEVLKIIKRPISNAVLKKLQAYTCGSDSFGIKVCCPPGRIVLEQQIANPSPNKNQPPDVSKHRNLHLLPTDCGYLDTENRIINGENAYLNEFPWMALLRYRGRTGLKFNCGGTIINKNYILTAAHCITGITSELVSVRVGEHSIKNQTDCEVINKTNKCNPPVQDLRIEQVIPHPQFGSKTFLNDIGLLRVSRINLNVENARPVCLPLGAERSKTYKNVIVTGWGVTNTETGKTSDILQKVALPVADKSTCTKTYETHNIKLTNSQICAGGVQNKDSCPGDSGGPMMVASLSSDDNPIYVQHGVVSFGPRFCGIPDYPGVYTLASYYMDWILDTIKP